MITRNRVYYPDIKTLTCELERFRTFERVSSTEIN